MFTAKDLQKLMKADPFRPFRITLSNGEAYDVTHHDAAWVLKGAIEVGMNVDPDGIAEYVHRCSILHIASISDLQPAAS